MDIWDEKPEKLEYSEFKAHVFSTRHFGLYQAVKMDAWLEKVKAHNDKLEMSIRELKENRDSWHRLYVLVNKNLKVLIDKILEWDKVHQRDKHAAPSILTDLEKILEAEG